MCDTMVVFNQTGARSFLAKNSDREPGELQFLNLSTDPVTEFEKRPYLEARGVYLHTSFPVLKEVFSKFTHPYQTLLSQPIWIWGAEMGVNEFGLAIGNEALFSKKKVPPAGLLGMDVLRLALHNCKTAREALDFIIALFRDYPQGGDGGYRHGMKYSSSFLIKDPSEAYVLESCNQHWVVKKVTGAATISNSYSIRDDFEAIDPGSKKVKDFKQAYENKLMTFFAQGDFRQRYSLASVKDRTMDLSRMKAVLRSHMDAKSRRDANRLKRGMSSLCVHPSLLIQEATTASFIVDYMGEQRIVWLTSSPHPCLSLFKPFAFSGSSSQFPFGNVEGALDYSRNLQGLARKLEQNYSVFIKWVKPLRDEYENEFQRIIYQGGTDETNNNQSLEKRCLQCFDLEQDYIKRVEEIMNREC